MVTPAELGEYLEQIRADVCSRCVERPPGGPPCEPLGKMCGVELHLPELVESIHQVRSNRIEPYLDRNRHEICEKCAFRHSSFCPCPMDELAVLIVQTVETVDDRRREQGETPAPAYSGTEEIDLNGIRQAYREAAGTWKGCDWPTFMGKTGLNLKGWTSVQAKDIAKSLEDAQKVADWQAAAHWLAHVEHNAYLAECRATDAVKAAEEGRWRDALALAEWAWALEFATGRPLRHSHPFAWQRLRERIEAAYLACEVRELSVVK